MMFLRLLKYNSYLTLRSKEGMFWTILYPILLSTLYFAAFSSLLNFSQNKINLGIEKDNPYKQTLVFIQMFNIIDTEEQNADAALQNKEIDAFVQNDFSLRVSKNGINQSIVKGFMEQIKQTQSLGVPINPFDYGKTYITDINEKNNSIMILFYSLLAMVSFYGMFGASSIPLTMQANISKLGARISATPMNRFASYISGIIFYVIFNLLSNILYICFVLYILKIPFITDIKTTLTLLILANVLGVTYGTAVGSLPLGDENTKSMFCVFSSLFLAFLSGMMSPSVKTALDKALPLINKINPIGLLTDNLYNVNILQDYNLLGTIIIIFLSLTAVLLIAVFINSRKVQYDSL
ncbi:ABC transporter permease [Treponema pedis]|uniref:ABC transporter permease n=1 Tax=Treponema pedis TaxID=409322 RepID=A0A7S6WQF2_9SPIR|nr:ABC transporter permease [Treponema pedis]QOW60842.1 ABC transporter permease [Treponema pedis]